MVITPGAPRHDEKLKKLLKRFLRSEYGMMFDIIERNRDWWDGLPERAVIEDSFAQEPLVALQYAVLVIKGHWPAGEAAIAGDAECAIAYARHTIKGRWPEGEAAIATDGVSALRYANRIIKGKWPEGEPVIRQNDVTSETYDKFFPEASDAPQG